MAILTEEQLLDTSHYQFDTGTVPVPELGWGDDAEVEVKTLSVEERDALPTLTDENGKSIAGVTELAEVWAAVVSNPKLSPEKVKSFLGKLPATALDRVMEKFGDLLDAKDEEGKDGSSSDAS